MKKLLKWVICHYDYTIDNLLDFAYFKKNHKLIAIDLSKQNKLKDPQQINFIAKIWVNTGATMFLYYWKIRRNCF